MEIIKRLKLIEACINFEDHALIKMQLPLLVSSKGGDEIDKIINLLGAV